MANLDNNQNKLGEALSLRKFRIMLNIIILCVGLILILIGLLQIPEKTSTLLTNIGVSILASGIIALFTILTLNDENFQIENNLQSKWGIEEIYATRSEMNSHTASVFPSMKKEYQQIAFGVKSLRDAYNDLFIEKAKKGLKIKFITLHPNSIFIQEREKIENKQKGDIRKTIIDLIIWIKKLQGVSKKPSNIQIEFYDSLPLDFYCKIDNNLYIGPYLYGKESQQTISYRFNSRGKGYDYYTRYFNSLWNSGHMKDLKEIEKDIENELQD